jgi:hypothetical protein
MRRFKKGTNDADDSGSKGGSLPAAADDRILRLEDEVRELRDLMRRNGWSM